MKSNLATSLAIFLAVAPVIANADENFPRHADPRSVDSVIFAAVESVEIAKRALIDFDAYDERRDPAHVAINAILARGYNMQRDTRLGHMYSMRSILERVKSIEDQAVRAFVEKRGGYCILMDDGEYEARPGADNHEAASFCRKFPDWKRYKAEVRAAKSAADSEDVMCSRQEQDIGYMPPCHEHKRSTEIGSNAQ